MSYDTPQGQDPKLKVRPLNEVFPPARVYPVMPPPEFWLRRHHWLVDEDGVVFMAHWHYRCGWHLDWSGPVVDPEDAGGWRYHAPVEVPKLMPPLQAAVDTQDLLLATMDTIIEHWQARALGAEVALRHITKSGGPDRTTTGDGHARCIEIAEEALTDRKGRT